MDIFDLHMHSEYSSDGEFPVRELIDECLFFGVSVFSVTDHNSTQGIREAVLTAGKSKLDFIPGIEIDCTYEGRDLHVIGYGIDWESMDFVNLETDVTQKQMESFGRTVSLLKGLGFRVDADAVAEAAGGKIPTAELIAEVMLSDEKYHTDLLSPYMKGGGRSDMPYINFYLDYCAQGKPGYVPVEFISFAETVGMIRDNGGTPVVAHPGLNLRGCEEIVLQLLDKGAAGLEVYNNYHTPSQAGYFESVVRQRNCLITGGSDFHGKTKPLISVGQFGVNNAYRPYLRRSLEKLMN